MRTRYRVAALLLTVCASPAFAADLKHCASIADDAARLACYDDLAGRKPGVATVPSAAATAVVPAPAATAAAAPTPDQFGSEQLRKSPSAKAEDASEMRASIVGTFEGWEPKTRFKLDNGQTWVVVDDRSAYFPAKQNPAVTIAKGMFGAYYLSIDGLNARAKVKRLQ